MFRMWNVQDVKLGMLDNGDVGCWRCGMVGMCAGRDV